MEVNRDHLLFIENPMFNPVHLQRENGCREGGGGGEGLCDLTIKIKVKKINFSL